MNLLSLPKATTLGRVTFCAQKQPALSGFFGNGMETVVGFNAAEIRSIRFESRCVGGFLPGVRVLFWTVPCRATKLMVVFGDPLLRIFWLSRASAEPTQLREDP